MLDTKQINEIALIVKKVVEKEYPEKNRNHEDESMIKDHIILIQKDKKRTKFST